MVPADGEERLRLLINCRRPGKADRWARGRLAVAKDKPCPRISTPTSSGWGFRPANSRRITTPLVVSNEIRRAYPERTKAAFSSILFAPGQKPLPSDSQLEAVTILLPKRELSVLGLNVHWLLFFFIVSLVAGYSLKGVFKVEV